MKKRPELAAAVWVKAFVDAHPRPFAEPALSEPGRSATGARFRDDRVDERDFLFRPAPVLSPEPFGDDLLAEKQRAENVYKSIEADHLLEFFAESCGDDLVGYDRGYLTFTIGETPKWTKGLNEKMDEALEAFCR